MGRTRPSMGKIRVEVDLLKPLPESVFVGQEYDESPLKGYTQKLEYKSVPKYYKHCQKLGHYIVNCRALEKKKANQVKEEGDGDEITKNEDDAQSMNKTMDNNNVGKDDKIQVDSHSVDIGKKQQEDGDDNTKIITNKEEKSMKKRTKKKKSKKMPKKKSKVKFKPVQNNNKKNVVSTSTSKQNDQSIVEIRDNIQNQDDQDVQDDEKQCSTNENCRKEGQEKEKAPNIQMEDGNRGSDNKENSKEEESKAEEKHKHTPCDFNTSTVPTEIRNLPGINLVVDLDCKEWEQEVNESSTNRINKNSIRGSDTENEDIKEVTESQEDDNQYIVKRGRSETRKSSKKSQRNRTHPSQRRKQREDNTPNCSYD
ncbi:uncharacterized protein [Nicotiana tomentosiformis]|uniref:uncharacterized protein n=1 Tax=Nicotiana tomentosiformis TaxID=4098 RepID=UPI00051C5C45